MKREEKGGGSPALQRVVTHNTFRESGNKAIA